MPYKRTGNPPGRPRKPAPEVIVSWREVLRLQDDPAAEQARSAVRLTRARAGFRRAYADPADALYRPPRHGARRGEISKRPMLHPNVIAKAQ